MNEHLWALSARELNDGYRRADFSPTDVTEAVFERIGEHEEAIGAFFTIEKDRALSQAAEADARLANGEPLSPLDGIPLSIKDLDDTAGVRTTYGYRGLASNVPHRNSVVAERVQSSGAVMLGKTTTAAFGHQDSSENLLGPITANPYDLSRSPGGSSAGAAAAAAVGYGPIHLGTDAAGSVRIPGALSGVVGFKPSFGTIPVWPQRFFHGSTVHSGVLAREVRDVIMAMDVLAGPDYRDPMSHTPSPGSGYASAARALQAKRSRMAFSYDLGYGQVSPTVWARLSSAIDVLALDGWDVTDMHPGWADPARMHDVRWATAMAASHRDMLDRDPDGVDTTLKSMIRQGERYSGVDVANYLGERGALVERLNNLFSTGIDFLVTPTMPVTAWPIHSSADQHADVKLGDDIFARSYLCYPFNLTGNPAISVPCGLSEEGLPVGLQIIGRLHDDASVLAAATAVQDSLVAAGLSWTAPVDPRAPLIRS
ncbi:amidase [Arthrobacter luteolus]|uniref:amidase n=1 Tax=Arthrobacter luteolus TaxID=98672 RepID=UPI00384A5A34